MDLNKLADALIPDADVKPLEYYEEKYPLRGLPEGAQVTRLAPSPTGFMHIGNLYVALANERIAHQSGGIFYLRIEDTDEKRKVEGAVEVIHKSLKYFGVNFDEGADLCGEYGPYYQRQRAEIYHAYAKDLIKKGLAYPCFCTEEDLEKTREYQTENKLLPGYYGEFAKCRNLTEEEIYENLKAGKPYVIRLRSQGNVEEKHTFRDQVKGDITVTENNQDVVILKSDGIPTYHFAHAVDDHLMGTTHVIRGEEWLPSLAKHLQLFRYLGFKLPKYMHIAQIMRLDENGNKKKLSKRDMGANMDDYTRMGYSPEAVCEYVMTLLNSNYEEWRMQNPDKPYTDFPFNIKKMSISGCLFDFNKLGDVSKNVLCRMSASDVTAKVTEWAQGFDPEFGALLAADPAYAEEIFAIGRGGKKPRKDLATWADAKPYMGFFYDELYTVEDAIPDTFDKADVAAALSAFTKVYDEADDMNAWFDKVKAIARDLGFADDMKAYKADPAAFKGSVADVSMFLRVAVTGKQNAPDLYTVMHILGRERTMARINATIASL